MPHLSDNQARVNNFPPLLFFLKIIYLFEGEHEPEVGVGEGDSPLSQDPNPGPDPRTLTWGSIPVLWDYSLEPKADTSPTEPPRRPVVYICF